LRASPIIWSVHDVTPVSLDRCADLVGILVDAGVPEVAILVIPAGAWEERQLATLRRWERDGHLLGLHGWSHRAVAPRGIHHRLHAALLSRDVAEHLGRPRTEVLDLVRRGVNWFADVGLAPPRLYVPPAWALGNMTFDDIRDMSFRWLETLTGVHDAAAGRFRRLPLAGFEADTTLRAWSLGASNRANALAATMMRRPLRVAVHPHDLELRLGSELRQLVRAGRPSIALSAL